MLPTAAPLWTACRPTLHRPSSLSSIPTALSLLLASISAVGAMRGAPMELDLLGPPCHSMPCPVNWDNLWNWAMLLISLLAVFLGSACGNSAGVGMGIVYVPLFAALLNFDIVEASFFSNALFAAGGLTVTLYKWNQRHPMAPSQRMIDIPVAALYTPLLLLGYSGGVFINLLIPAGARLLLLATLLTVMVAFTLRRGLTLLRLELNAISEASDSGEEGKEGADEPQPPLDDGFPVHIVLAELLFVWLVHLLLLYVLDYTQQFSRAWWTFHILKIPLAILVSLMMMVQMDVFTRRRGAPIGTTSQWRPRLSPRMSVVIVAAGVASQVTGLAGGMVLSPLLLYFGKHPLVGTATSSFMITFAASAAALELGLVGNFDAGWLLLYVPVCVAGAYVGLRIVSAVVARYHTPSVVVLLLAGILAVAAVAVYAELLWDLALVGPDFLLVGGGDALGGVPLASTATGAVPAPQLRGNPIVGTTANATSGLQQPLPGGASTAADPGTLAQQSSPSGFNAVA